MIVNVITCCLLSAVCLEASEIIHVSGFLGGEVTIHCFHERSQNSSKYFCQGTCLPEHVLVKMQGRGGYIQKERYSLEDRGDGLFTVTVTGLVVEDSGTYWCGVGRAAHASLQEIHLTVSGRVPSVESPAALPGPSPETVQPTQGSTEGSNRGLHSQSLLTGSISNDANKKSTGEVDDEENITSTQNATQN
ncbi:CMRF35-like molecule 8 isoform X2 [Esox lucius]|uniref:CMRF35-like molecule 8 isoform X2 n=1 Tax=Esox lucius TaxID=8010 RepID=UPI001476FD83|nr:CMRF35-like molecule 8 isoform X2 [Esox lucius]